MADDSLEILDEHAFHPADPAHGMRNYDLGSLRPAQQRTLNKMKMIQRVENENYLKAHPEIKGLISILLRYILCKKPLLNVHEMVGSFFIRPVHEIAEELRKYLVDNCHSSPAIDTLYKEKTRLEEESLTDSENGILHRQSSIEWSEFFPGSVTDVQTET